MKQTKVLMFLLLAMILSETGVYAQTVGTYFTVEGITYQISKKDLNTHDNQVVVCAITGTGGVTIPPSVTNSQDKEEYRIVGTQGWETTASSDVASITFPEGVENIARGTLRNCSNLNTITIPSTCTSIGEQCFEENPKLTSFSVSGGSSYKTKDGVLMSADGTKLIYYPSGKQGAYTVPSTVTEIGPTAFSGCEKLTTLTIPASVTNMYFQSASGNNSIQSSGAYIEVANDNTNYSDVNGILCNKNATTLLALPKEYNGASRAGDGMLTIPGSITTITQNACKAVPVITGVKLNNTATVSKSAFEGCDNLVNVEIGAAVSSIGDGAFSNCKKLQAFVVSSANQKYKADDGVLLSYDGTQLVLFPTAKGTEYTIPSSVTAVNASAFKNTTNLETIHIAPSVKSLGDYVFRSSSVKNVIFDPTSTLESIGLEAFQESKLENVTLPASLKTLSDNSFYTISTLKSVTVESNSNLEEIPSHSFANCANLESFTFSGSANVTAISSNAFANDVKLKSFEIPNTVTSIGKGAFLNTPSLESVTFKETASISEIGEGAFGYCGVKSMTLPQSVTTIKQQAFDHCANLKTIDIPANLTSVETGAFNFCESLVAINVSKDNATYSSLDGMLCDKNRTTLLVFPAGKSDSKYTLVPYFSKVAAYAFYASSKVTNITFPKTVTSIDTRALALCENLKSLSFMGVDEVPALSADILFNSSNPQDVTIYVRKDWFENSANSAVIANYKSIFKDVHPSFVTTKGYDRGTEFFPTSTTDAGVISFYKERTSVIINPTVKEEYNGEEITYNVSSILDFAYETANRVKAVTVLADMGYVGMKSFRGSSIEQVFFVSDTPSELGSIIYEQPTSYPFKNGQNVYVKETKVDTYKDAWQATANGLHIGYQIPTKTLAYRATACYPFDVVYNTSGDVIPYLPLQYKRMTQLSQDKAYVRAKSIDNGYVPAFFGVMLASENSASASSYCQMDENQAHTAISDPDYNAAPYYMVGVVEDTQIANTADRTLFGLSKSGVFKKVSDSGNTIPYFKAYLSIPNADIPMGAKSIQFVFGDFDSETTDIDGITENGKDSGDAPYYNLNGVQVSKPSKGVYIHNGKKIIIK